MLALYRMTKGPFMPFFGLTLTRPTRARMEAHRDAQRDLALTYPNAGATLDRRSPPGFAILSREVELGRGKECFARAKTALRAWKHFELGWVEVLPAEIAEGATVTLRSAQAGFHTLNACRIVRVVDEPLRFAFAYGTLAGHIESGEEVFEVVLDADDRVRYRVFSFSRVASPWLRFGTLIARIFQRRFLRDSCAAMQKAVQG
jgi:uncharacterized protein (UPF0548 family)